MDNDDSERVKERPAQADVRYRPGTLAFATTKLPGSESDQENEKSPFEKLLEDESEKEKRRRQIIHMANLGFVLGTPANESDGTILFNYDEPPPATSVDVAPSEDDEYRNPNYNIDSDSTLNNALKRAIREQQDQEVNRRFMECGSSGSSLETVESTGETEDHDVDPEPCNTKRSSQLSVKIFEPRTEETFLVENIANIAQNTFSANTSNVAVSSANTSNEAECIDTNQILPLPSPDNRVQQQSQEEQQQNSDSEAAGLKIPVSYCSGTVKKKGFFRRIFGSKNKNSS